ncbi:uncharacterized protein MELLADRAFT_103837 [Melampsora larici-populina 98AG31]|uniref:Secreted protein n=1 Tax=Melampsora larici-populina (strain 98AG31 / pathotype 3-4-7) TaxID=747676 RepID=F4RCM1_MELLP|nr:uncharacterized protein MELLADRAFT_103837 [Melampsora larici-populina 98AG31]EGG09758.1 hypothetical protein MELLADRAFT_103837 [Melampsora larici-populina 98AG31]
MHKWIFLRFSLILSFTIFQDLKVSAVPSPQTPDPQLIGVHCAKQFGGYWDIPEYTIACKDASLNKYICNQASCFVGPLPPSPSQAYGEHNSGSIFTKYSQDATHTMAENLFKASSLLPPYNTTPIRQLLVGLNFDPNVSLVRQILQLHTMWGF